LIDLTWKKAAYQRFGVPSYWIVDPDPLQPSVTAFELLDGRYTTLARVEGNEALRAERPFAVQVVPALLLAGLPGRLHS
jgi:Uma2 family endonuclease